MDIAPKIYEVPFAEETSQEVQQGTVTMARVRLVCGLKVEEGLKPVVEGYIPSETSTIAVEVDGESRSVDTRLMDIAVTFNSNADERTKLAHNCLVFAHACLKGDDLNGFAILDKGEIYVDIDLDERTRTWVTDDSRVRDVPVGTVLGMSTAPPTEAFYSGNVHFVVRATADSG